MDLESILHTRQGKDRLGYGEPPKCLANNLTKMVIWRCNWQQMFECGEGENPLTEPFQSKGYKSLKRSAQLRDQVVN